jgi:hypothetical protein
MSKKRPYVIYYRPIYLLGVTLGVLVILVLLGSLFVDRVLVRSLTNVEQLETQVAELKNDLLTSQSALIRLQLSADVDAAALEQARQKMVEMQSEIYRRDQELVLYREMLQDNKQPSGLSIYDLKLTEIGDRRFRYIWVARQKIEEMKALTVNANLWVIGLQGQQVVSIPIDQLDPDIQSSPIKVSYKYFTINEGIMELPADFTPQSVRVTLRYPWMKAPQFDQTFDWQTEDF